MSWTATSLISLADIEAASARIRPLVRVTPLVEPGLAGFWLKCENLQSMGAFKIRGALNMIAQLPREALPLGVVGYSSGNHGQAVALAARSVGTPALIVMPTTAPAVKVRGVRAFGAEVVFAGTTAAERQLYAETQASARGMTLVPSSNHPLIIAGQGSVGLEILEQRPTVGTLYAPVGGGGLVSGVAAAIKLSKPEVRVVGVEPSGAARMTASLAAGTPVSLPAAHSIADGLLATRPGDLTFQHVSTFVDEVVTVHDDAIATAMKWLFGEGRIVAEPSGAATTAAVLDGLGSPRGEIVAIVSGGNVDAAAFAQYIDAAATAD